MSTSSSIAAEPQQRGKFIDPNITAKGERRAWVSLHALETLWFNTGTLCNLACENCYIESSPTNDQLVYLTLAEVEAYLDEIERDALGTKEIGFTGGEPFMNKEFLPMLASCLARGYRVLVLTNAMKPMQHKYDELLALHQQYGTQLHIRVSVDHYSKEKHEAERGPRSWQPMLTGLQWLASNGFSFSLAGRTGVGQTGCSDAAGEAEVETRAGYAVLIDEYDFGLDPHKDIILFPEMDEAADVPEITTACWGILGKKPTDIMCSNARMVVKAKGDTKPSIMACTLLAYDQRFNLGTTLKEASKAVPLNHPHCATFCVLGGASCSG